MVTIRSATRDDIPTVVGLWDRAAGPTRHAGKVPEATQLWARDPEALLVAVEDDRIVGTLIIGWDGWRCHMYRLAVDPEVRRRGIARSLFEEARTRARALGAVRIDAMVHLDNPGAIDFWTSEGFEIETKNGRYSLSL